MFILKTNEELIAEAEALKIAQRRPEEARLPDGRTVAEPHQEFIAAEVGFSVPSDAVALIVLISICSPIIAR